MKDKNWAIVLSAVFLIVTAAAAWLNVSYKKYQNEINTEKIYNKISAALVKKVQTLIEEKKNATLTISLALAQDHLLKDALTGNLDIRTDLENFSLKLREETDFKNVWFQLVDRNGTVVSRSWSSERGDDIFKVRSFKDITKVHTSIDVDKYDLSFRAFVPLFDDEEHFLGFLETITHFNSIAKKIDQEGFRSIIVVDKVYSRQLIYPFSGYFADEYYIANKNIEYGIIDHIREHSGIAEFLDYKSSYRIDHDYLIVHYTLFDQNNKPMAYMLMFQELGQIDTSSIRNMNLFVDIFTLFGLAALGLLLVLLYNRHGRASESTVSTTRYIILFSILFASVSLVFYTILAISYKKEKEEFYKQHNFAVSKEMDVIREKYKVIASFMYQTIIDHAEIIPIMQDAYGDTVTKENARKRLYSLLVRHYRYFVSKGIRQLHFHLKNNESFLRFHRPGRYGDNLTGIRQTVEWVNTNHLPVEGFEEGRIYNGFRYVFPITDGNSSTMKHLGSVETSFSATSFIREFGRLYNAKLGFVIDKHVVDNKVFTNERTNYVMSPMSDFYYEGSTKEELEREFRHIETQKLDHIQLAEVDRRIYKGEIFTVSSSDEKTLFTFIPLHNPVTGKVVAAIILQTQNNTLLTHKYNYIIIFIIGIVLFLLATIFVYREYLSKILLRNLSLKTRRILDTQKSIIVITNGREIYDVNKRFLDFFGYGTLQDFKKDYKCVCHLFIEHGKYFDLRDVPEGTSWVEYLQHIPDKDRVVLIRDKSGIEYSMAISYDYYENEYYVVTFNDVSGTIQERNMLQNKVMADPLTGAYNREFFNSNIERIIYETEKHSMMLGIIYFDIDHFKRVNDTYGHDVGDYVLRELVKRVKESVRESDYLIRWGGEEFIILISVDTNREVRRAAEHLRSMIEHLKLEHIGRATCSFGTTLFDYKHEDVHSAIKRADDALYLSKTNGRNRVTVG